MTILDWRYCIYKKGDGQIVAWGIVQSAENLVSVLAGWGSTEYGAQVTPDSSITDTSHWYNQATGTFVEKLLFTPYLTSSNVIAGLPDPCRVIIKDEEYTVTGGSYTVVTSAPEEVEVYIDAPQYMPVKILVQT